MVMIDGQGELSLEQVKEITDSWNFNSDSRPLVAHRLWKEIDDLRAAGNKLLDELEKNEGVWANDVAEEDLRKLLGRQHGS